MSKFDLQLFADESGAEAAATEPASTETGESGASPAAEAQPSFDEVLKDPAYKAEYDKRVGAAIAKRFKTANAATARNKATEPMIERICSKYGIQYSAGMDLAEINAAMDADDSYLEDEADRRGMSVESLRAIKKVERENAQLRAAEEQRTQEAQFAALQQQAEALQGKFPGFDLPSEMQNESFLSMIAAGVPMEAAFKAIHMDEIMQSGMGYAAQQAQARTVKAIASNSHRPAENGMGGHPAVSATLDPTNLTDAQREDIKRRVMRGEKISF